MTDREDSGAPVARIEPAARRSLVDRMIAPYLGEPGLWPVLIVLLAHGVLGIAVALIHAIRDGMGFGLITLVLVSVGTLVSLTGDVRRRHLGVTSASLLGCWAFGALTAWAADRYGLY